MTIDLPTQQSGECSFCKAIDDHQYFVAGSANSVCFVPDRACAEGAMMVVSRRHVSTFLELSAEESLDLLELGKRCALALVKAYDLEAFNFWWDTGILAGQERAHVAVEILPRKEGDGHVFVRLDGRPSYDAQIRRDIATKVRSFAEPVYGVDQK